MKDRLVRLSDYKWLMPRDAKKGMLTDAIVYATQGLLDATEDTALAQLANVACLPGIVGSVVGMPDMHWGYGLPVGAVGAFDAEHGVISAGCTGYDINCGVHMLKTDLDETEVRQKLGKLADTLFAKIPCGVGATSKLRLSDKELASVLTKGAQWAVKKGYDTTEDVERMEDGGCLDGANPGSVSSEAMERGAPQLGTLGAGNHFLEIQTVDEIFDADCARAFGIHSKGQIAVMIHCGSRGFGHQVATDYLKVHEKAARKFDIALPDPQLVCAPVNSKEAADYLAAMRAAANYAFANRQMIAHWVRESFEEVFAKSRDTMGMRTVYDVAHNICKLETHTIGGEKRRLYVHRKGATRAFAKGRRELPPAYSGFGQPVLIAGSMGTASYILSGTGGAMSETFGSSCHGAGRSMSRNQSLKAFRGDQIRKDLEASGKVVRSTHARTLAEEAPGAYKDIELVIESVDGAGISMKIARMVPLGVVKG
jgi:tRNA-splicing ligase RtcB